MLDATQLFDLMVASARGELSTSGQVPAVSAAGIAVVAASRDYPASSDYGASDRPPARAVG